MIDLNPTPRVYHNSHYSSPVQTDPLKIKITYQDYKEDALSNWRNSNGHDKQIKFCAYFEFLMSAGDWLEAENLLNDEIEKEGLLGYLHLFKGLLYLKTENYEVAKHWLKTYLIDHPEHYWAATSYLDCIKKDLNQDAVNRFCYEYPIVTHTPFGNVDITDLENELKTGSIKISFEEALNILIYNFDKQPQQIIYCLDALKEINPFHRTLLYVTGLYHFSIQHYDIANQTLGRLLLQIDDLMPTIKSPSVSTVTNHLLAKTFDKIKNAFCELIEKKNRETLSPIDKKKLIQFKTTMNSLFQLHMSMKEYSKAISIARCLISTSTSKKINLLSSATVFSNVKYNALWRAQLAYACVLNHQFCKEASLALQIMIQTEETPRSIIVEYYLNILIKQRNFDRCFEYLHLLDNSKRALVLKQKICSQAKKKESLTLLKELIRLDCKDAATYQKLAEHYISINEFDKADEYIQTGLNFNRYNWQLYLQRASTVLKKIAFLSSQPKKASLRELLKLKALDYLDTSLKLNFHQKEVHYLKYQTLFDLSKFEEALTSLTHYSQQGERSSQVIKKDFSKVYMALQDYEKALIAIEEYRHYYPHDIDAVKDRILCLYRLDRLGDALNVMRHETRDLFQNGIEEPFDQLSFITGINYIHEQDYARGQAMLKRIPKSSKFSKQSLYFSQFCKVYTPLTEDSKKLKEKAFEILRHEKRPINPLLRYQILLFAWKLSNKGVKCKKLQAYVNTEPQIFKFNHSLKEREQLTYELSVRSHDFILLMKQQTTQSIWGAQMAFFMIQNLSQAALQSNNKEDRLRLLLRRFKQFLHIENSCTVGYEKPVLTRSQTATIRKARRQFEKTLLTKSTYSDPTEVSLIECQMHYREIKNKL